MRSQYQSYTQRNAIYGSVEQGDYFIDSRKFRELERFRVEPGDFIVSCSGTIGCIYQIPGSAPEGVINQALLKISLDQGKVDSRFFLAVFRSASFQERIKENSHGGAMQNLVGMEVFRKTQFQLPPTKAEQEAIAEALSHADALIESLEQLLAKKRHLKQGAMQELLTGKKRLPGYRGEWELKSIAEIADCLDNLRIPLNDAQRTKMKGDYPYCGANGILDYIDRYCVDDSVILMAEDGGYFDEFMSRPIAYRMSGKFWVNNHAHILKSKPEFNQDFLFYSLVHKNILSFLASGTRAKLNKSELNKISIRQPANKAEQTAIAVMLSDMDVEIVAIKEKLVKVRQLKQGMTQELLTGRIRLV